MNSPNLSNLPEGVDTISIRTTLIEAAKAAALITLPMFRNSTTVFNKQQQGFDPVTKADREAELAIRDIIGKHFPDHSIIGEEHANKITNNPFTWVIDPIDGTRAFISGVPVWGTLIGLAHEGKTIAGLMSQPFIGETFLGLDGATTYQHGRQENSLSTSSVQKLEEALLFTTSPALFKGEQAKAFAHLESQVRLSRYGCDCYAYCLLAAGHIDLVVENRLNIYDIAALIPIVQGAGGVVTTFDGGPPDQGGDIVAAATPQLHQAAMQIMRDC